MYYALLRLHQGHAVLGTGGQHIFHIVLVHDLPCRLLYVLIPVADGLGQDSIQLLEVWGDIISTCILLPLYTLWVHKYRHRHIVALINNPRAHILRAGTLAVVGDNHRIQPVLQGLLHIIYQPLRIVLTYRLRVLEVQPQHLLMAADYPQLGGSRSLPADNALVINPPCRKLVQESLAMVVIARKACNRGPAAQKRQIVCHVGRAAQGILGAGHMVNRHRRLRRNTGYLAIIIPVQHHIAHYQDSYLGNIVQHKIQQFLPINGHRLFFPLCYASRISRLLHITAT